MLPLRNPPEVPPDRKYFLCLVHESSGYSDRLGSVYHYSENVPNHTKIQIGDVLVFDRKSEGEWIALGFGMVYRIDKVHEGRTSKWGRTRELYARLQEWQPLDPPNRISANLAQRIRKTSGYNSQYSIREITRELCESLVESARDRLVAMEHGGGIGSRSKPAGEDMD